MKSKRNNRLKDYNKCAKIKCEKIITDKELYKMFKKISKLSRHNKETKKYWKLNGAKTKCVAKKCTHLIKGQLKGKRIKRIKSKNNKNNKIFRNMLSNSLKKKSKK